MRPGPKRNLGTAARKAKSLKQVLRDKERCLRQARLELDARDQQLQSLHVGLLSAAHKAGMSEVAIVIVRAAATTDNLVVRVADNGHGVPPELATRIFEYGFSTRHGGHGFGLHISELSAKEMGGTLTVQSEGAGAGSTFTLTIPLGRRNTVPLRVPEPQRGAA